MKNRNYNKKYGFTLLELLIVIGIIAILAVALILVLNPAEIMKKSRDVQRMSDLNTLKSAVGIYTTTISPVYLAGASANTACKTGTGGGTYITAEDKIYYSYSSDSPGAPITDMLLDDVTFTSPGGPGQVLAANLSNVDGTGWLPINFDAVSGGSPISNLPLDPTNTVSAVGAVVFTDLVYRYACNSTNLTYEIDAKLESTAYTVDDNKMTKDGGNNANLYEVGTNLKILGVGTTNQY